ncbi:hypothetical protein ACTXJR_06065 [Glutamicibacter ardleyensis]|uniref:hypothetical protein n=1 Tax=Glutamicibacter ardleyensis TaxID=225894 RepID=UPI003FCF9A1A
MTTTITPAKVLYVENTEGDGSCGHCGREGLKYVAHLKDGGAVGLSCARKLMGVTITPKEIAWTAGYEVIATYVDLGNFHALWKDSAGRTRSTKNGYCYSIGGQIPAWKKLGWL